MLASMKKKLLKRSTRTEAIDIAKEVKNLPNVNTPLVSSSPVKFNDFIPYISDEENNEESLVINNLENDIEIIESQEIEEISTTSNNSNSLINYDSNNKYYIISDIYGDHKNIIITKTTKFDLIKRIVPSTFVAVGTGLAMMPIFNNLIKNSEQFGVDIHSNKILFELSTANTFIITAFSSFATMYNFIKKQQEDIVPESKNICIFMSKIGASWSVILPLGLLWTVELHNQAVADSQGFDEFMAWATFTTVPLVIDRIIESVNTVDDINKNSSVKLENVGSKLIVYGLTGLSIAGRAIAYTEIAKAVVEAMGIDETTALVTGIVAGGILGSGGTAIFEYQAIKSLFEHNETSCSIKKVLNATASVIEGAWLTLPLVSLGLKATEEWNPLLKGFLFTPLFISHSTFEANKLYDNINATCNSISDGFLSLKQWCCNDDDIQLAGDNGDFVNE